MASMVSGFGGLVSPPFSRFYIGGEDDVRGFDIRTISPVAFYPTVGTVCNRDNLGNQIMALDANGRSTGVCGSSTRVPYYTPLWPGGDTEVVTNLEYRIPIAGPVTAAYFVDMGSAFITRSSQLQVSPSALNPISQEFPYFSLLPKELKPVKGTNFRPRGSTGIEFQVILPVLNAPFRIYYAYNFMRFNDNVTPPQALAAGVDVPEPGDLRGRAEAVSGFQSARAEDKAGVHRSPYFLGMPHLGYNGNPEAHLTLLR